jgi:hypothetical protein
MTNILKIVEEVPTFIKRKHELEDVHKQIHKGSKEAVALLVSAMNNLQLTIDVRLRCAKDLIQFDMSMADQISKDTMNRLIAEIKVNPNGPARNLSIEDDEPQTPVLDFSTIREI